MADPTPTTPTAAQQQVTPEQFQQLMTIVQQLVAHQQLQQQLGPYGQLGVYGGPQAALGQSGSQGLLGALGLGGLQGHTGFLQSPTDLQRALYPSIPQGQYIQSLGGSLQKPTAMNYLGPLTILNNLLTGLRDRQTQQQFQQAQQQGQGQGGVGGP